MKRPKSNSFTGWKVPRGLVIVGSKVRLREKKLSDARNDYRWQTDTELARLDAAPVMGVSYPLYLLDYAEQLHHADAKRYPLAIETLDGRHIGNCTCYEIDNTKGEAQLGIMIGDRSYWDRGYGTDAVNTMVNHVFQNAELKRIYLKTLAWNLRAQHCFRNCGFLPCGQLSRNGSNFMVMELTFEQWARRQHPEKVD